MARRSLLYTVLLFTFFLSFHSLHCIAQGRWVAVSKPSPDFNNGVMLLLPDGSVMVKSCHGGSDTIGDVWNKLTPDTNGSYVNGAWSQLATMQYKRLYCSSQILNDGRVYVAGGEYGTGSANGEIYDPQTDKWVMNGPLPSGNHIYDGNSEILENGKILQAIVSGGSRATVIYNPATNTYSSGPTCLGSHDEAAWLKLPDNSILFVDINSRASERYFLSQNKWVRDAPLPVSLYDPYGFEAGASFMLPDGRAFFIGSPGTTAYYTPSGIDSAGAWAAGPPIPGGFGAPDAAAAMMVNGKILCAFSPLPTAANNFPSPTVFFEFDYTTNSFTRITAPDGADTMKGACYATGMLDLPDGSVLFSKLATDKYYVYIPDGGQLAVGKPVADTVIKIDCNSYMAVGTGFNGISEGAAYGDDWQMPTNYPIIRLIKHDSLYGDFVHYARTHNWNSRGVMRGSKRDTVYFDLPVSLPADTYNMEVVANGIHSDSRSLTTCNTVGVAPVATGEYSLEVFPNPANGEVTVKINCSPAGKYLFRLTDVLGRVVMQSEIFMNSGINYYSPDIRMLRAGLYIISIQDNAGVTTARLLVE